MTAPTNQSLKDIEDFWIHEVGGYIDPVIADKLAVFIESKKKEQRKAIELRLPKEFDKKTMVEASKKDFHMMTAHNNLLGDIKQLLRGGD